MDVLSELISVCAAANTDKITERKKQIEKMQQLLTKPSILKTLDKHSALKAKNEKRNSQLFAWDNLFSVTRRVFEKEVESLRKLKEATTLTAQTNRDKKKHDCYAFVKTVVRLADKRGQQNLKGEDVTGFVLHVLRDEFMCSALGMDMSTLLFKHILSIRRYWAEIPLSTWHEMMSRYCKLLQDPPPKTDKFVIARIIYMVMIGASQQCDIRGHKLLPLLQTYFKGIKKETSNKVVEQMMSTLCVVTESLAVNGRVQVCRLGEELIIPLLFLWKRRSTDQLKDQLVDFLRLQMQAHHPRGAATEDVGAYAIDWDQWKSDLKKLYEAIYNDLEERTGRSRFSTAARDLGLKENYVDLAVDVCHQLFREKTSVLDVTQAALLQTQPGGAAKRRRVESGWGMLSESITRHTKGLAIPWLQLILGLVTKYPSSLPEEEAAGLLSSLQSVQAETKHPETLRWVLRCLRGVARSQQQCGADWVPATRTQVEPIWAKVWAATLRTLSLHQAEEVGYELLSSLIAARLVVPDTNLWTLFLPAVCPVSKLAVTFITHYLQHLDLHERYRPALLVSEDSGSTSDNYPLRHQLLSWLFPTTDQYDEDAEVTAQLTARTVDPYLLAETAVVLTLRDTRSIRISNKGASEEESSKVDFETIYLQTSFDLTLSEDRLGGAEGAGEELEGSSSCLNTVQKHLMKLVERDSKTLLESTEQTMQVVETTFLHCTFLVRILDVQLSHSVVTETQLSSLPIFSHLKQLMKRASTIMTELLRRDRNTSVNGVLAALSTLFACDNVKDNNRVAKVVVRLTPAILIDQLLDLAQGKREATNFHNRSAEELFDSDTPDDMDLGSVTMDGDGADSQEDDGFSAGTSAGCDSLLSPRLLTETQQQRFEVVRLLCRWSRLGTAGPDPEVSPRVVIEKLLDMLDEDGGWDPSKAYDLQLLRAIVEELTIPQNKLDGNDINALAVGLWNAGRSHRRDQEICGMVLGLVTKLSPHLSSPDDPDQRTDSSTQDARETCLQLVGIFRKLSADLQFSHKTRMNIARCMVALLKADPAGDWAVWKNRGRGDADPTSLMDEIPKLLQDQHHSIRLLAAENIRSLFVEETTKCSNPRSRAKQDHMFDTIYIILTKTMVLEGQHSKDEQHDEGVNRTSSLLHALAAMATSSTMCEKKAMFAFYQAVRENQLDQDLVTKVLEQVARQLSYPDLLSLMTAHLPYLLTQWLDSGYTLTEFPHRLVGYSSVRDLYTGQLKVLVPVLVMRQSLEEVEKVARRLHVDLLELLKHCLAKVIIHILPHFAQREAGPAGDRDTQRQQAHATKVYDMVVEAMQKETVEQCIMNHLDEIVVDILMTFHDSSPNNPHMEQPEPNPPCFSKGVISATLEYITKGHITSARTVIALLAKTHDGIQRVLLSLHQALAGAHCLYEKCRVLSMYKLFVGLLLAEFDTGLGGSFAFVLRDVLFTLLVSLQKALPLSRKSHRPLALDFGCSCLKLLENVCNTAVNLGFDELGRFLPSMVGVLVTYAAEDNSVGKKSLEVLQLLIVDHQVELTPAIRLLAPPPDTAPFRAIRKVHHKIKYTEGPFSLKQELEHFVLAQQSVLALSGGTLEALTFLYGQLSTRKEELAQLVADSKDVSQSPIVSIVSELLHLTRSTDEQLMTAAARCLGELGPVDLSTVALTARPHQPQLATALQKYEDDSKAQQYCHLVHLLDKYLIDPSVDVVTAASQVLKRVLSTKTGVRFYADYNNKMDNAFKYLHPFKASKKKVANLPEQERSEERFACKVDQADLWVPESADHTAWVTGLVCALIDSGAVHDEILLVVTEICKVKVEFCEVLLPYLVHDVLLNGSDSHRVVLSRHVCAFIARNCQQSEQTGSRPPSPATLSGEPESSVCQNQASVRVILSIVQYLRLQDRPTQGQHKTPWDNNFWLDVDYLQVARAATSCAAYFSTILYAEIWCNIKRKNLNKSSSQRSGGSQRSDDSDSQQAGCGFSQLESLGSLRHEGGVSVQELMLDAYRNLGDPDGVYGCGAGKLADTNARIQTYEHEGQWGKAVGAYDLLLSQPSNTSLRVGLMQALQKFGTGHVLDQYLEGLTPGGADGREVRQFQYEAAWRNARWEHSTPTRFSADCGYQECLYSSLWAIKEKDRTMLEAATKQARFSCLVSLREGSVESVRSVYPILSNLQCLTQIEDTAKHIESSDLSSLLNKWCLQNLLLHPTYDYVEQPLLQRCRLLQLLPPGVTSSVTSQMTEAVRDRHASLVTHLEHFARRSREAGRHQVAERAMAELHMLSRGDAVCSWRLEEARLYWARGETDTAKHLMKGLLRRLRTVDGGEASALYPRCLGVYGNWLAETRSESPKVIMKEYLVEAVHLLEESDQHDDSALGAYVSLGRYADAQYQQIVDYMGSPTFEAKQALAKQAKADAQGLRQMGEKQSRYLRTLDKQSAIDESEVATMVSDKQHYLQHALTNYIKCLTVGDKHDLRIFRITSLWFDNKDNSLVNKQIKVAISKIKSYKFLPLMYQLAARMGAPPSHGDKRFPQTLESLLERVSTDHPHHTVAIILALANAKKDDEYLPNRGRAKGAGGRMSRGGAQDQLQDDDKENLPPATSKSVAMPPPKPQGNAPIWVRLSRPKRVAIAVSRVRVKAAKALIARLKNTPCVSFIEDMERLSEAYIELANFDVEKYKKETKPINLPSSLRLTGLKDLRHVGVLTADIKVDPTCEYKDLTYIQRFEPTFKLAGGINLPKIICCLGSDGLPRRQLVKGKDDLRQDAVMQQVFGMVNHLLSREAGTKGRHLLVRTYKVIPLSQRSGLLEWCEGTVPFGEYLIGSRTGAHQRYRPQDLPASSCRAELAGAHDPKREKKRSKLDAYRAVCERFQPVFRHFFMEKFPDPTQWYQRRLAYTRSVATNSIVGYILGLGDRHVQNILIDCKTAELIHIDLGVAFEQGRILPTPETVPFRLTRDVVDGMGITGVEGVYRRCCECTLDVLRGSGEALLTILTVLLYDPLYAWTISPLKAYALQSKRDSRNDPDASYEANTSTSTHDLLEMADGGASSSGSAQGEPVNKVAERVLLRLRQKLAGHEQGVHLSVSGQVNLLIQEATDPDNLCRLYPGWQPYI